MSTPSQKRSGVARVLRDYTVFIYYPRVYSRMEWTIGQLPAFAFPAEAVI